MAEYPQWVANIVPVPKKDGKVRMCVDYRDLNRVSPKDNFPLPHIDLLVDNTAQHSCYSFMDGVSRYNQIRMAPEDKEKTTFITTWGTFCYKVMPFGLKNAGETYQRAMVTLFHDMMHKEVELYVDDMIAMSKTPRQHIDDLCKLLERLQKYRPRLNPAKCTFGVGTRKLLGFIVNERGIVLDPDKVKAIRNMPTPKTEIEVRGFLGRCQEAFKKVKQYLEAPPVLVPTVLGKPLILYLTVLKESMGGILGSEMTPGKNSKKFTKCEQRYLALERMCYALVWAAKRLRQYMLAHTTWLIAKMDPFKYIFEKPTLTRRIAHWQMALSKYDIVYTSQKAIKGSALAEQLAYYPLNEYHPLSHEFPDEHIMEAELHEWKLWFDGASNLLGNRIGVVLASPKGQYFPFSARLGFDYTNNMVEYEACAMGITMAIEHQINMLKVFGDLRLVNYQLRGEWETRDAKLVSYHSHIMALSENFDEISFHYVPRDKNQMVDALATLSAMLQENQNKKMTIHVWQQTRMAHCQQVEEVEIDGKPWYHDIRKYLEEGT
ncbi:Retrovirus-related Pol polyprotein from transposon 17.6, partial [Mucuna pruriens]